jgi:hypothetical protein
VIVCLRHGKLLSGGKFKMAIDGALSIGGRMVKDRLCCGQLQRMSKLRQRSG